MVDFTGKIVEKIKVAGDVRQIRDILEHSIHKLSQQAESVPGEKINHIGNMLMVLRSVKGEGLLQKKEMENLYHAIEITERMLDREYENLF